MLSSSNGPGGGGVSRLLASLLYGLESHMDGLEDSTFLQDMIMGNTLHLLIKVYERLQSFAAQRPEPEDDSAEGLAGSLAEELQTPEASPEIRELLYLLSKPHVKSLLSVHDAVAQRDYEPKLPPLPALPDGDDEDSVKIIRLVKSQEPLGATVKREGPSGAVVVVRVMKGGAADLSGLIREGDVLREVNGVPVEDPKEIIQILAQAEEAVTFTVMPAAKEELAAKDTKVFVRALFSYDPREDPAIPCKEAGLQFRRGDVLEIVSREDDTWWQARHHGNCNRCASLIPSSQLQERRVLLRRPEALFHPQTEPKQGTDVAEEPTVGLRRSFRLSIRDQKIREVLERWRSVGQSAPTQIFTYQEVVPHCREPGAQHRLVLLMGPSGVGVSELKRRLLISDPEHFGVTVPHTTRDCKKQEKDGVDYHFVSRHTFEKDILDHKFIQYGQHEGNYYGTSVDSVRRVLAESRVCLLDVEPSEIGCLYTAEFKPYVVFVKPPPMDRLRLTRRKVKVISNHDALKPTKSFTDEDFEHMIASSHAMEGKYGHFFEKTIINDDVAMAFTELRAELRKLETESHWIPVFWEDAGNSGKDQD